MHSDENRPAGISRCKTMESSTNMVQVFPFKLLPATTLDTAPWIKMVSADERSRAERISHLETQSRFLQCRVVLRTLLGRFLASQIYTLPFAYQPGGKPEMGNNIPLRFNLAHSGDLAVIAIAQTNDNRVNIGVDMQQFLPVPRAMMMAKRFFHPLETAKLTSLPNSEQEAAFLRIWVRKEACLKAVGAGIEDMLASFSTIDEGDPLTLEGYPAAWLYDLAVESSAVAALACTSAVSTISITPMQTATELLDVFNRRG